MRPNEVDAVLKILFEVYPRRIGSGNSKDTLAVWSALLSDADAKDILKAAVAWARSNKPHPPTPGELLALAAEGDIHADDSASEAWGHVRREMHNTGADGEPDLPEKTMRAVRACGGDWSIMVRDLKTSEVPALRARFIEAYNAIGDRLGKQHVIAESDALLELARPLARQYALTYEEGRKSGQKPR